eukprot:scaffold87233_cov66-Phaeocystis_antarctica.AAC.3
MACSRSSPSPQSRWRATCEIECGCCATAAGRTAAGVPTSSARPWRRCTCDRATPATDTPTRPARSTPCSPGTQRR